MSLITSEIPYSNKDKIANITLPTYLGEDLAEFIGIIIGDGHLEHEVRKNSKFYSVRISCNYTEDMDYFENTIQVIFKRLFNIDLSIIIHKEKNYFIAVKCSKAIVKFLSINFSIPIGNKTSGISIPSKILNSDIKIKVAFIRGLTDMDFSLSFKKKKYFHSYPVIKCSLKSKSLVNQLNKILIEFGFKTSVIFDERNFDNRFNCNYERHSIYLSGVKNLEKWVSLISFKNPRLLTKYFLWKKFGFCPPSTSLKERMEILSGKRDLHSNYTGQGGFEPPT